MPKLAQELCTRGLGKYAEMGFTAYEEDDHTLVLEHEGKFVGRFSVTGVTLEELQKACHQHLNEDIFRSKNMEMLS